jgi:hypothetical protein
MRGKFFVLLGMVFLLAAPAYAFDDHDFQVWNTDSEEFKINKDSKIVFEQEFRWGDNASEFFYQHYDVGFFYNLEKFLNVGGGYRRVYEEKKDKFRVEDEPYVTTTLLWDLKGFKFEDRSRLEYRYFDYQSDSWRYRNKITAKLPCKFTKLEIQPFISDEIFIGFNGSSQFNQNRFSSGLGMNLTKNIKAEIYYMLQSSKGSDVWSDTNVLGTKVKIAF